MVTTPDFLPENKTLTPELVATLPKICLQSRGDLSTILAQAKNRHVIYVEHLAAVADVPRLANIAEESGIMVGFVVDCTSPTDLEAIMDDPTGLIVGAVAHTPEVAALLRNALVPYVYDGSPSFQAQIRPGDAQFRQQGRVNGGSLLGGEGDRGFLCRLLGSG